MAQATLAPPPVPPDEVIEEEVTTVTTVKKKAKKPKNRKGKGFWKRSKRRFKRAMKKVSKVMKSGWEKTKKGAKTAYRWSKTKVKQTGAQLKRFGRWTGRQARSFGRWTVRVAKATPMFIRRTIGYILRAASWVVRTVLATAFRVTWAAFLVAALAMTFMAFTHDKYESKVHRKTKTLSKGKKAKRSPMETEARRTAGKAVGKVEKGSLGKWTPYHNVVQVKKSKKTTTDDQEGDIQVEEKFSITSSIDYFDEWFVTDDKDKILDSRRDLPIPDDLSEDNIEFFVRTMTLIDNPAAEAHLGLWEGTVLETEKGKALTDNAYYITKSYWLGRLASFETTRDVIGEFDQSDPWPEYSAQVNNKVNAALALAIKNHKDEFDARRLHQPSFVKGWKHQQEWMMEREKRNVEKRAEEDVERVAAAQAAKKASASKKTAAKKTAASKKTTSASQ